jgi:hypothetical protein
MLSLARCHGDKRPGLIILSEAERRSEQIRRAENEAHRPKDETGEVIVHIGSHYPLAGLHEGEILHRGVRYIHPMLVIE